MSALVVARVASLALANAPRNARVPLVLVLVFAAACNRAPPGAGRPVILVSIDCLRADHCTPYGYRPRYANEEATTPFLSRLAAAGVLFEDAVSPSSWTLPAHVTLLTGMDPYEHGVRHRGRRLRPAVATLADRFAAAGYATAGFYSGPFLHPVWGFGDGFDTYAGALEYLARLDDDGDGAAAEAGTARLAGVHRASHEGRQCTEKVIDRALAWLAEDDRHERPFFLFLHLWDPHDDYEPPADYGVRFDPAYTGTVDGRGFMAPERQFRGRDLAHVEALYDAEIRYTDDQLARFATALEELGAWDEVVFAVTADHGEEFYDHGRKGHQRTLYREVLHVPLVLRAPGLAPAGRRVAPLVRLSDVAPTLLDLVGLPPLPVRTGASLAPFWDAAPDPPRAARLDLERPLGPRLSGWREGGFKLILDRNTRSTERYDLDRDPDERTPLAPGDLPDGVARRARRDLAQAAAESGHADAMVETAAMTEALRQLGDLGGRDER